MLRSGLSALAGRCQLLPALENGEFCAVSTETTAICRFLDAIVTTQGLLVDAAAEMGRKAPRSHCSTTKAASGGRNTALRSCAMQSHSRANNSTRSHTCPVQGAWAQEGRKSTHVVDDATQRLTAGASSAPTRGAPRDALGKEMRRGRGKNPPCVASLHRQGRRRHVKGQDDRDEDSFSQVSASRGNHGGKVRK